MEQHDITKKHAVVLDLGEHGQGLVYLDNDDNGVLQCRYRVWTDDETVADFAVSLPDGAGDDAVNLWEGMQTQILNDITPDKFIGAAKAIGVL